MVAQAAPFCADVHTNNHTIKLLDLLRNRYHVGIVRESSEAALDVELPASVHLQAGQRVRFVVAGDQAIVAKQAMQRGFVTQVSVQLANRMSVRLEFLPDVA